MSVDVGIDVHRKRSQVRGGRPGRCGAGEPERAQRGSAGVGGDRRPAGGHAGGVRGGVRLGLAGRAAGGRRLRPAPGASAAVQGDRLGPVENDKVDAAILAQLLRADLLPEAWIAPPAIRALRALLRHRIQLVRLRTLLRNRIHAVLADHGYDRPAGCWSGPGRQWLAQLPLPAVSRRVIDDDLALIDALAEPIAQLDAQVAERAKADPRVKVLTGLPGVGELTALMILAEVGDFTRFANARKLAAWAGLTPTVRGSDLVVRHGHISKQGSAWLRWILCEAAQTAKRSPEFAPTYQAILRRRGKNIATTAVARKLLTRAHHLLTTAETPSRTRARHTAEHPAPSQPAGMRSTTGRLTTPRASSRISMSRPRAAR
jgi:transposase